MNILDINDPDHDDELCFDDDYDVTSCANKILNGINPSSQIALLAFGKRYRYGDWMERQENPVRFCPLRQCSRSKVNGLRQAVAKPLDFHQAKYIEPNSDMLDYEHNYR